MVVLKQVCVVSEKSFNAIPKQAIKEFISDYTLPEDLTWEKFKNCSSFEDDDMFKYDDSLPVYKLTWHSSRLRYDPSVFKLVNSFGFNVKRRD